MFRYHTGLSLGKEQAISEKVVASCICNNTENEKKKKSATWEIGRISWLTPILSENITVTRVESLD